MRCLLLALAVTLVVAGEAQACSCAGEDPRVRLSRADAAFAGTVTAVGPAEGPSRRRVFTFAVERAVKGRLGATVDVVTAGSGASCGLELAVGARTGLLLDREGGRWEGGLCDQVAAGELERAARPYPVPPRRARALLLAAGTFGDAGLVALDGDGRLAGYAFGTEGEALSVCPGGRVALQAGDALHAVRLRDLRVIRRVALPGDAAAEVRCLAADGRDAVALTFAYGSDSNRQTLVRVTDGRIRRLYRASIGDAELGPRAALLAEGVASQELVTVPYTGATPRVLLALGSIAPTFALSPDGARVALLRHAEARPTLSVLTLASGERARRRVGGEPHSPVWLDRRRLVAGRTVYRPSLAVAGRLPGELGFAVARRHGMLWTLTHHGPAPRLRRLVLPDGPARTLRAFDLAGARALATLPAPTTVRPAVRRAPRPVAARSATTGGDSEGGGVPLGLGAGLLAVGVVALTAGARRRRLG